MDSNIEPVTWPPWLFVEQGSKFSIFVLWEGFDDRWFFRQWQGEKRLRAPNPRTIVTRRDATATLSPYLHCSNQKGKSRTLWQWTISSHKGNPFFLFPWRPISVQTEKGYISSSSPSSPTFSPLKSSVLQPLEPLSLQLYSYTRKPSPLSTKIKMAGVVTGPGCTISRRGVVTGPGCTISRGVVTGPGCTISRGVVTGPGCTIS